MSAEEEAAAAEAHAKLMETKRSDLALLEATLVKTKKAQGEDTMQLAEDQEERSETQLQLKADEKFFDETKKNCQAKAEMWSARRSSRPSTRPSASSRARRRRRRSRTPAAP